ncbi:MAG: CoA pyrophosphatase [Candidatus Latescibacterota bacterium]
MITLQDLRAGLAAHRARLAPDTGRARAAVALVLAGPQEGSHLLFIERTEREGDPWSGHLAFPGGRLDAGDADPQAAAERETLEEVGLDLSRAEVLGRLDDLTGATLPVQVAAFVYHTPSRGPLAPSDEVRQAFWVGLEELLRPERQVERRFPFRGLEGRSLPAIDLLGPGRPVLWGITYRFTAQLLRLAGHRLPRAEEML